MNAILISQRKQQQLAAMAAQHQECRSNEERLQAWQRRKNIRLLAPKARFSPSIWKPE